MKHIFIELTMTNGKKFIGNLSLLQRVSHDERTGKAYVTGWNNNGGFEVNETYEQVIELIKQAQK